MKANEIKKGNVVEYNNGVYQIRDIERSSPQGRGGNVRFRFVMYSVPGGNKLDASFDGDDDLREVELMRRQATFSYKDGEAFVFLDDEDYTPYTLDAEPGTYVLTDWLAANVDRAVVAELGLDRHPELRDAYFGHYRRVVWLAQHPTPRLRAAAERAAGILGLPLETIEVGDELLAEALQELLPPSD